MKRRNQKRHLQDTMKNLATIRIGDTVKIVNCMEEDKYEGKTFEVNSEPYQISGTWCVKIGEKGWWDIACLEKVEADA